MVPSLEVVAEAARENEEAWDAEGPDAELPQRVARRVATRKRLREALEALTKARL